tara:strand:- start:49 stop:156 length:108 start_codon:yes stop_codon:yes gene_type:complete
VRFIAVIREDLNNQLTLARKGSGIESMRGAGSPAA